MSDSDESRKPMRCYDPAAPGKKVVIDRQRRVIQFYYCHQPRSGMGIGFEELREIRFDQLHSVRDFLCGNHRGLWLRILLRLGTPISGPALASLFVSTDSGRARIFQDWVGFAEMREQLHQITAGNHHRAPLSEDPRMIPVFVVLLLAITGGIIWLLL